MSDKSKQYVISGIVKSVSGKPFEGFEVTALDKDLISSDLLGTTKTDAEGRFEIHYTEAHFADFLEKGPDIYLLVKNVKGQSVHLTENALRSNAGHMEEFSIVLSDTEALQPELPIERSQFKKILNKNPQYFNEVLMGQQSNVNAKWDPTLFEELTCVGLRRADHVLEAVFHVKKPYGFGGGRCSPGTKEWVTFWIDYQDGNGWIQAGPPVSVNVHDLTAATEKGVWYAAQLPFEPAADLQFCSKPQVVKLRAILSWEVPHVDPATLPLWGNRRDGWILLKSKRRFVFPGKMDLDLSVLPTFPMALPLGKSEIGLLQEYSDELVAGLKHAQEAMHKQDAQRGKMHEFLAKNVNYYGTFSQGDSPEKIQADFMQLPSSFFKWVGELPSYQDLLPQFTQYDTTQYEELTCLGLYPERDLLEATVAIKRPTGYITDTCHAGSPEFVAYYIDYGSGWEYVGTDKFQVHDVANDPTERDEKKPLRYASRMFVANMRNRAQVCSKEQVIKAKAILSWNLDPTPMGPNHSPIWGNAIERLVEVRPRLAQGANPEIKTVSAVDVDSIGANGLADSETGSQQPFGKDLGVWGYVDVAGANEYRLQYRKQGTSTWQMSTIARPAKVPGFSVTFHRNPDADGWFSIGEFDTDHAEYPINLCHFDSAGKEGLYELRLEVGYNGVVLGSSNVVQVMIDNEGPTLHPFAGITIPNKGVTVVQPCGLFVGNEDIVVYGNFEDTHYSHYQLYLLGGGGGMVAISSPAVGAYGTVPAGYLSSGQELTRFKMRDVLPTAVKCGYVIQVYVWDRTIVGNAGSYAFQRSRQYDESSMGFIWEP